MKINILSPNNFFKDHCSYSFAYPIIKSINLISYGDDLHLYATGSMVAEAIELANKLKMENINCSVFNFHTIKPIDTEQIKNSCKKTKTLITMEEHSLIGGLKSAVSEVVVELGTGTKIISFGINDKYPSSGDYKFMLEKNDLTANQIIKKIKSKYVKL